MGSNVTQCFSTHDTIQGAMLSANAHKASISRAQRQCNAAQKEEIEASTEGLKFSAVFLLVFDQ